MIKFAVISFPGTNCENENVRAFKRNGMDAETVLWNDPGMLDGSRCKEFDGYCIAGGFSYEDRGRSGVVAAQDPVMDIIAKEAAAGKVVLGICNGAQVLVETGLIPGYNKHSLAIGLAWNEMKQDDEIIDTGFYNAWSYLKNEAPQSRSAFNGFDDILHIPFAHGEGRFMMDEKTLRQLEENDQIVFKYCNEAGEVSDKFPITPNGAVAAAAAICNPAGNVMSIMPHPERDPNGNGSLIFGSIRKWIEDRKKAEYKSLGDYHVEEDIRPIETVDLEIMVRLIITDNTERTIEETLIRDGMKLHLDRYQYYGIKLEDGVNVNEAAQKIMATGELANFNKHMVTIKTKDGTFSYDSGHTLVPKELDLSHRLIVADQKDFVGQSKKQAINLHADGIAKKVQFGIMWNVSQADGDTWKKLSHSKVLYNPHSMYLMKAQA